MGHSIIRTANFARDAAHFILDKARDALGARDEFRVALSGGNTPRPVHREFAALGADLPWERVRFTFGDERCVPPESEESNYRMARETLFEPAGVPEKSVLRMRGEIQPVVAAEEYEETLISLSETEAENIYRHDLIILGMGLDGHTASLFPGTAALEEQRRWVVANYVPKLDAWRITFTYRLIAAARHVMFLIDASKHGEVLERVLQGDQQFPAARVEAQGAEVTWVMGSGP